MLLDDIRDVLSSGGTTADGTELAVGLLPDQPDKVLCVYETGGVAPYRAMRGSPGQPVAERPRIQVVARAGQYDYAAARLKINDAYLLLEGLGDRDINGVRYLWIGAVQAPFLMQRDEVGRPEMAVNFDVTKRLSTA